MPGLQLDSHAILVIEKCGFRKALPLSHTLSLSFL